MNATELIELLQDLPDPDNTEVRIATQPPAFYILAGSQIGYLPAGIGENQGWRG